MGMQSARIYYQGKDHKEIYFDGHYHDQMYIGSRLVWEKLAGEFRYVVQPGKSSTRTSHILIIGKANVNWGDGKSENIDTMAYTRKVDIQHTYSRNVEHIVTIRFVDVKEISFMNDGTIIRIIDQLPKVMEKSINQMFSYCKNLETLPEWLFDNCSGASDFVACFDNCENLQNIPAGLFAKCANAVSFDDCFSNCGSLKTLPRNLFQCPKVRSFRSCFYRCTSLEAVPEDLFAGCQNVSVFTSCFGGCAGIKSTVPQLWLRNNVTQYTGCFAGCINALNFEDIPNRWKGL